MANDGIEITLLYSNKTKDDILLLNELNELARKNPKLRIFHTLTRHNEERDGEWDGFKGRISADMIQKCGFPENAPETLILWCGPWPFYETCERVLRELGYDNDTATDF